MDRGCTIEVMSLTTQNPEDESIVIASALGFDAGFVERLPVKQRMLALLDLGRYWPVTMLFSPYTHHQTPKYRWAGRSSEQKLPVHILLGEYKNAMTQFKDAPRIVEDATKFGEQTSRGFVADHVLFTLEASIAPLGRPISQKSRDEARIHGLVPGDAQFGEIRTFLLFEHKLRQWFRSIHTPPLQDNGVLANRCLGAGAAAVHE